MKLGITAAGPDLAADVDPRFGRCPWFLIVDTDDLSFESMENPNQTLDGGGGIQSAKLMFEKGVKCVLTGNCGPNAHQALSAAGISVIVGCAGSIQSAIEQYQVEQLNAVTEPNVASHFGFGMPVIGGGGGGGMGRGQGSGQRRGRGIGRGQGMGRRTSRGMDVQSTALRWPSRPQTQVTVAGPSPMNPGRQPRSRLNPEPPVVAKVDLARCTGCGSCIAVCPVEAIRLKNGKAHVQTEACAGCGTCAAQCGEEAIRLG